MEKVKPMMRPNNVRVPPRTNLKSSRLFSCSFHALLLSQQPNEEESQSVTSEMTKIRNGKSIGLNILVHFYGIYFAVSVNALTIGSLEIRTIPLKGWSSSR